MYRETQEDYLKYLLFEESEEGGGYDSVFRHRVRSDDFFDDRSSSSLNHHSLFSNLHQEDSNNICEEEHRPYLFHVDSANNQLTPPQSTDILDEEALGQRLSRSVQLTHNLPNRSSKEYSPNLIAVMNQQQLPLMSSSPPIFPLDDQPTSQTNITPSYSTLPLPPLPLPLLQLQTYLPVSIIDRVQHPQTSNLVYNNGYNNQVAQHHQYQHQHHNHNHQHHYQQHVPIQQTMQLEQFHVSNSSMNNFQQNLQQITTIPVTAGCQGRLPQPPQLFQPPLQSARSVQDEALEEDIMSSFNGVKIKIPASIADSFHQQQTFTSQTSSSSSSTTKLEKKYSKRSYKAKKVITTGECNSSSVAEDGDITATASSPHGGNEFTRANADEIGILAESIKHCSKKNVVKNIMSAFLTFMNDKKCKVYSAEDQSLILRLFDPNASTTTPSTAHFHVNLSDDEEEELEEIRRKFKRYIVQKSLNHYTVRLLILHPNYGQIFRYFLTDPIKKWINNSKVADLSAHIKMIGFFLTCFQDAQVLEELKCHDKKRAHFS